MCMCRYRYTDTDIDACVLYSHIKTYVAYIFRWSAVRISQRVSLNSPPKTSSTHLYWSCFPCGFKFSVIWCWKQILSDWRCWLFFREWLNVEEPENWPKHSTWDFPTFTTHTHWQDRELLAEAIKHFFVIAVWFSDHFLKWFLSHNNWNDQSRDVFWRPLSSCMEGVMSRCLPESWPRPVDTRVML